MAATAHHRPTSLGLFADSPTPWLYDRTAEALRVRHNSCRTEKAYICWIHRYIGSHSFPPLPGVEGISPSPSGRGLG